MNQSDKLITENPRCSRVYLTKLEFSLECIMDRVIRHLHVLTSPWYGHTARPKHINQGVCSEVEETVIRLINEYHRDDEHFRRVDLLHKYTDVASRLISDFASSQDWAQHIPKTWNRNISCVYPVAHPELPADVAWARVKEKWISPEVCPTTADDKYRSLRSTFAQELARYLRIRQQRGDFLALDWVATAEARKDLETLVPMVVEHLTELANFSRHPKVSAEGLCYELYETQGKLCKDHGLNARITCVFFRHHLTQFLKQRFPVPEYETYDELFPIPHGTRSKFQGYTLKDLWNPEFYDHVPLDQADHQQADKDYVLLRRRICGELAEYLNSLRLSELNPFTGEGANHDHL